MFVEYLNEPKSYRESVTGGDCDSEHSGYLCSLPTGHMAEAKIHKAGVPGDEVVAEWDDDRSTD